MKERPILFSEPMSRAIIVGWKTMTRRLVDMRKYPAFTRPEPMMTNVPVTTVWMNPDDPSGTMCMRRCPFGVPGDRLWVRETARIVNVTTGYKPWYAIEYKAGGPDLVRHGKMPGPWFPSCAHDGDGNRLWCPSIHMPRWACRTVLEVVRVREERLQDISEADAKAEGVTVYDGGVCFRDGFAALWDSINGKGAWAENPWVWVVEFKVVKPETAGGG